MTVFLLYQIHGLIQFLVSKWFTIFSDNLISQLDLDKISPTVGWPPVSTI